MTIDFVLFPSTESSWTKLNIMKSFQISTPGMRQNEMLFDISFLSEALVSHRDHLRSGHWRRQKKSFHFHIIILSLFCTPKINKILLHTEDGMKCVINYIEKKKHISTNIFHKKYHHSLLLSLIPRSRKIYFYAISNNIVMCF